VYGGFAGGGPSVRESRPSPHVTGPSSHKRYGLGVTTVGLRQLRQQASHLVRRAEAGEEVTITVAGRARARLVPASTRSWRSWSDVEDLFSGPEDPRWDRDRQLIDHDIVDPRAQR